MTLASYVRLIDDTSSQIFNGINVGYFGLQSGSKLMLNSTTSGGIVRNRGSTLEIGPSGMIFVANGALTNTNGIIGGWATTGNTGTLSLEGITASISFGSDWATVGADGGIYPLASYSNDVWASANNTSVTQNSVVAGCSTTNSLRFVSPIASNGSAVVQTVALTGANVISSGGVLVTSNVTQPIIGSILTTSASMLNGRFAIAGGTLTSGNGTDLIVNQFNPLLGSSLTISSAIVDNGATSIGLTLGGNTIALAPGQQGGLLILTNPSNSYTGPTAINATTMLRAGAANVIPTKSAVIISMLGTLDLNGYNQSIGSLANFDQSLAALSGTNFGYGSTVAANGIATLTVGGDNTSTTFNGALKDGMGTLSLVKTGAGTLTLGNSTDNITIGVPNLTDYSGSTRIVGGTLQTAAVNTLPLTTSIGVAGGAALVLNGFSQSVGSLSGAGTVTNNSNLNATLTVGNDNATLAQFLGTLSNGILANPGALSLAKIGSGTETLTTPFNQPIGIVGYDSYTGPTVIAGGTLLLDMSNAAVGSSNLLNPASVLTLAGGTLAVKDRVGSGATVQNFVNGTIVNPGASAIAINENGNLNSASAWQHGDHARLTPESTVDFGTLPAIGSITTTTANSAGSILGGWATVGGGATWAVNSGNSAAPGNISGSTLFKVDDYSAVANDVTVTTNSAPASPFTINSLRFNANGGNAGFTLTLPTGTNTIDSGGILITPAVGAFASTITHGSLTSGNGQDLIVNQYNTSATLTIRSTIVDNGATPIALTKSGPGTLILTGGGSYTGGTYVNSGILSVQGVTIGSSGGAVNIAAGAELDLQGGAYVGAFGVTINGTGVAGVGAVDSVGGNRIGGITVTGPTTIRSSTAGSVLQLGSINFVGGPPARDLLTFTGAGSITISGSTNLAEPTTINSSAGNLTIAGTVQDISFSSPNTLTLTGSGNITINANLKTGEGGLTYAGTGTLTLATSGSAVSYTGPTTIASGVLLLDFSSTSAPHAGLSSSSLVLAGGSLVIKDTTGANATQQLFPLATVNAGSSTVSFVGNGNSNANSVLTLNNLTRNQGGTLNLVLPAVGNITTTAPNNNGILGGWATVSGADWATNSGLSNVSSGTGNPSNYPYNISALAPASYANDSWNPTTNTTVTSASNAAVTSALTTNSLRFADSASADTVALSSTSSANPNIIVTGGVLVSSVVGALNSTITGGFLTTGNGTDLIVNQFGSGTLTISSVIVDNGSIGLTLSGGGALILAAANAYSGPTYVNAGALISGAAGAVPAASALHLASGTTWTLNGYSQSIGSLTGAGNITNNSATAVTLTIGNDNSSPPPFTGMISDTTTNTTGALALIKVGTGILTLTGANSYSGGTTVNGGTLRLAATVGTPMIGGTAAVSNGATLELAGLVSQLSQSVNVANAGTLLDSSSMNQNVGAVTGTGNTIVNASGSLTAYDIRQNTLTIAGNAKVTLLPSGSGSTTTPAAPNNINFSSNVAGLSIDGTTNAWTGSLDIGNNSLIIQYGAGTDPYATIVNMIKSGYGTGNWTGTGIISSLAAAAANSAVPLNIGLLDFIHNTPGFGTFISFAGQTITTSAVLIRLSYMDDLTLAGDMAQGNATTDALRFAANFGTGTTWSVGDLNHDGVIDTSDALLFAANYVVGLPSLDGTTGNAAALGGGGAAVPEPASVSLAVAGAFGLVVLARRRRGATR